MIVSKTDKGVFRALADTYICIQKERIRAENRLRSIELNADEGDELRERILSHLRELRKVEKAVLKDAEKVANCVPVYKEFLSKVKGIGPAYAIKLLALPLQLGKPLSSWNAYFGLVPGYYMCVCENNHKFMSPKEPFTCIECGGAIVKSDYKTSAPRRKTGYRAFWNPRARSLYFNIAKGFIMAGENAFYCRMYRKFKEKILNRKDLGNLPDIRKDAMARRSTFKLFLAHYYQAYHELEGLPYRMPYAFEYLNHEGFIHWTEVVISGG